MIHETPTNTYCVRCAYNLYGLPEEGSCPECGLAYDRETRAFRAKSHGLWIGMAIFTMMGLVLLSRPTFGFASWFDALRTIFVGIPFLLGIVVWFYYAVRRIQFHKSGFVLAVTPAGLLVRVMRPMRELVPWDEVVDARIVEHGKSKHAKVTFANGGSLDLSHPPTTDAEKLQFVDAIRARLAAAGVQNRASNDQLSDAQ
ncbi:MAG: hypothetical protein ACPGXK_15305 [Phycisphaerae bacterium]